MIDFQTIGIAIGGSITIMGTILRIVMRSEAKEAVKEDFKELKLEVKNDVKELKDSDKDLHGRITAVERNYVECKHCNSKHADLKDTLNSMDGKLDILIKKK